MTDKKELETVLDEFHEYLFGILEVYQKAVPLLKEELSHILDDELQALDENMNAQQSLLLRTKNFNVKLAEYQSALDIPGGTLSEMALRFPEERRIEFFELIGQFQQTLEEVEFYKEKCTDTLQNKLYHIDKALTRKEMQKKNTTYNENAAEVKNSLFSRTFETKI